MTAPVVTGDESLAARRVTLLEWLARGRDIRLAAELSGETRDWATATAVAAGHPHLDKVREALAEARRALAEERALRERPAPARAAAQPPATVRPIRQALAEHVASYTAHTPIPAPAPAQPAEPHLHTFVEGRDGVGGYAHCAGCDTTWRSAPCEVCAVTVAAAHISRTGRARHTWHPESTS